MPTLGSNGDADIEDRLMDAGVGEEGQGGMNGEKSMEASTIQYVKQRASGNLVYDSGNSNQGSVMTLWWEGLGGGPEVQDGGHIRAPMPDSC